MYVPPRVTLSLQRLAAFSRTSPNCRAYRVCHAHVRRHAGAEEALFAGERTVDVLVDDYEIAGPQTCSLSEPTALNEMIRDTPTRFIASTFAR